MSQLLETDTSYRYRNHSNRTIFYPDSSFRFYREKPGYEIHADFVVSQDHNLPIPELAGSGLTAQQYEFLHAYNLAGTLAAIKSADFPGAAADGIAYPFEYSVHDRSSDLNKKIVEVIETSRTKEHVNLLEIGGQGGQWIRDLQAVAMKSGFELNPAIIDLDFYRRFSSEYPDEKRYIHHPQFPIKYIQADAHHLLQLWNSFTLDQPDVVSIINVGEVIFDPFSIFEQAWELLPDRGILIVADSHFSIDLPYTPFSKGKPVLEMQNEETETRYLKKSLSDWRRNYQNLLSVDMEREFFYNSRYRELFRHLGILTDALYKLRGPVRFDFKKTLEQLGVDFRFLHGYGNRYDTGRACAIFKDQHQPNPFTNFQAAGVSKYYFHVGEYVFPQIHRFLHLD